MSYLAVFDGNEAGWAVSRDALLVSLARTSPAARPVVDGGQDLARDVTWSGEGQHGPFEICHHRDGTCLYLDGTLEDVAPLAIWYRTLVPADIELGLCDDAYSFSVEVTPEMTEKQLVDAVYQAVEDS